MEEADRKSQQSLWAIATAQSLWLLIPAVAAISVLIGIAGHERGIANDCSALGVTQDGQCGLATAMGDLFGIGGGGLFFFVGVIVISIQRSRARPARASGEGNR